MLAPDDILTLDDLLQWERELASAERERDACAKRIERLDKLIIAGRVLWPRESDTNAKRQDRADGLGPQDGGAVP